MPPPPRSRRTALAAIAVATIALVLGGCAGAVDSQEHSKPPSATLPAAGPAAGSFDAPGTPPEAPGFEVGGQPERVAAAGPASPPVRLVIPAIGVTAPLVRLGLEPGGGMAVRPTSAGPAGSPGDRLPGRWGRR